MDSRKEEFLVELQEEYLEEILKEFPKEILEEFQDSLFASSLDVLSDKGILICTFLPLRKLFISKSRRKLVSLNSCRFSVFDKVGILLMHTTLQNIV